MDLHAWSQRLRIRIQKGFFTSILGLTLLGVVFAIVLTTAGIYAYYYVKYSRMIDARLSGRVLQNTTQLFSAPQSIAVGQVWSADELTTYLTKVGYRPGQHGRNSPLKIFLLRRHQRLDGAVRGQKNKNHPATHRRRGLWQRRNRTRTDHQSF